MKAGFIAAACGFVVLATASRAQVPAGIAEKEAEAYVSSLVSKAKRVGVPVAGGTVLRATGSAADAIAETAKKEGVDLIVIGTRGLGASGRLFLGSVSAGVVANSDVTVIVVK